MNDNEIDLEKAVTHIVIIGASLVILSKLSFDAVILGTIAIFLWHQLEEKE